AIFPHPTMATLSTLSLPAARKIAAQPLLHWNLGRPSQPGFQFLVAVASFLPFRVPSPAVEHRRQLSLGPVGIFLPQPAQHVTHGARNVDGCESLHVALVLTQELSARRKVVVHDVE